MFKFKIAISIAVFIFFTLIGSLFSGCNDGWASPSIGHSGACSHHGGVSGMPGLFMFIGFVAGVFAFLKLSSINRMRHREKSSIDTVVRNVERLDNHEAKNTASNLQKKKELISSIEKYARKNQEPQLKIFFYSDGLLLCEVLNRSRRYELFTKKLNALKLHDLQVVLKDTLTQNSYKPCTSDSGDYIKITVFSDNAHLHSEIILKNLNEPSMLKLKNILINALPVLAAKL
ncbi:TPA: hypothetical protein ACQ49S_004895 [Klebsiella aerogenes]